MTRVEIAEKALAGIFEMERAAGRDAGFLGTALRFVVGAWLGHGFTDVLNDLEIAANKDGFVVLYQHHVNDLKASGKQWMPHAKIEQAKREIRAEQRVDSPALAAPLAMDAVRRG